MAILAGYMLPHPPLIIPEVGKGEEEKIRNTIEAYRKAAQDISTLRPETIVLCSPHQTLYADYFHISPGRGAKGDFRQFGAPQVAMEVTYDREFAEHLGSMAGAEGLHAGMLGEREKRLDHGTLVPLYFVNQYWTEYRLVRVGLSGFPLTAHYRLGQCIRKVSETLDRKVVVIASGDLSHRLKEDGPYGYRKEGPEYDARIMDVMGRGDFGELLDFPEDFCEKAAECGHRSFTILGGAFDGIGVQAQALSYEGPFGVGYGICTYRAAGQAPERNFLEQYESREQEKRKVRQEKEDAYVKLARYTIQEYVCHGRVPGVDELPGKLGKPGTEELPGKPGKAEAEGLWGKPGKAEAEGLWGKPGEAEAEGLSGKREVAVGLPEELYHTRAGAFVSLKEDGKLRGCIGTIQPVRDCLAEEIIHNAISACSQDPRFPAVEPWEVERLTISVDVLGDTERISSPAQLDVKRYGVIVTKGARRGLLLPNLEGVDTVEQQIAIAKQKAGIREQEKVELERFEVVRHE